MRKGPSRTAASVAFRRAAHQILAKPPVFVDLLARVVLSPEAQSRLDADPWRATNGLYGGLGAWVAVRSRIAEDWVATAVTRGVKQYVVLGAGLDTFAYRNPFSSLNVFEVDHPSTQTWKLERLRAAGLLDTPRTTHVPVDFETQSVAVELRNRGFDPGIPTAISWLGVVPYQEVETVWATLEWACGVAAGGGHIVFDYANKLRFWNVRRLWAQFLLSRRVARAGEPFRNRIHPDVLRQRLIGMGFVMVDDMDHHAINQRYFTGRTDGMRVDGGRIVVASTVK
ncbi:MAG TPA: class I SAM-dependent methyltransferase [Gemmatimonadaceae bacterium]